MKFHREKTNAGILQTYQKRYNELVDIVNDTNVNHKEFYHSNRVASEKSAFLAKIDESKNAERTALKTQLEKRINEVASLPGVEKEKMVIQFRVSFDKISKF